MEKTLRREEVVRIAYFTKHGQYGTRLYNIWANMKRRCSNPNSDDYKHYGARGISVCEEWNEFTGFYSWAKASGYTEDLTLDRIDVDGNYEPCNCRWVDMKEQENNRTNNVMIEFNGECHTRQQWSEITGIKYTTIRNRIDNLGWPVEKALTTGGVYGI